MRQKQQQNIVNGEINKKFKKWYNNVEKRIIKKIGLTLSDLPDENYWEAFENNIKPTIFAKKIIKNVERDIMFLFY